MKFRFQLLAFLFIGFVATSCGDDDSSGPADQPDTFIIDGNSYDLTNGTLEDYGGNGNGSFDWDVTITGITNGEGNTIYLDLNSDSSEGLTSGTYNWASSRGNFTIVAATIVYGSTNLQLSGGSVEVTVDGTTVSLSFDLTDDTGNTVTGGWSGVLTEI